MYTAITVIPYLVASLAIALAFYFFYKSKKNMDQLKSEEKGIATRSIILESLLENLEYKVLTQNIVSLLTKELNLQLASLMLLDQERKNLQTTAISHTSISDGNQVSKLSLEQFSLPLTNTQNPAVNSLISKSAQELQDLHALVGPVFTQEQATQIQQTFSINSLILFPLHHQDKQVGVLIVGFSRLSDQISEVEKDTILNLSQKIGSLIDHSLLFSSLQTAKESLAGMTQQIYTMNAKLHQLDKLKDDFVSVASHELRTPMTAIRSYVWMALNRSDMPLSDKLKRYLTRTLVSTERLINLVNDMLNVSRIESGRVEIVPKPFNLLELIRDCVAEVGPKAAEKNLHINIVSTQLPEIFADSDKVHQVALNLIGNALKFTPVDGKITISFFSDGTLVQTDVKDSGVGISRDDLSHLFKKFGRLDNSYVAAATSGGTGLGLYISKSLVDLMKGKIWATSEGMGRGSSKSHLMLASWERFAVVRVKVP